ncbi:carbon monoxide dehydrogenase subunit G [Roseibacterium sp. SDUM158016]|uniref:SRPBCC family protein n=1 Tax=Roseicyclus sediminis TaxID=2980997 RepID=UPI0021D0F1BB|nr:carbon monoxide dehydrogenase subunit G [Roseibacterium sp. SDUM158016]MCU4652027.1 carbon monoxide dehydrogenase subunit G [Roseibacterium sp. SDUM158016]
MHMDISGSEEIEASRQRLWEGLNDPDVLTKCIPGCRKMTETAPDAYDVELELKVAAVGGSFNGTVALTHKRPPEYCRITVSGEGSLGTGTGTAEFTIVETGPETCRLDYSGEGEIGGLVAGVGQRILKSVAKHLTKQFFKDLRKHFDETRQDAGAS